MFQSFKANRKSISDSVADYLKELIQAGKFQAGDKMKGEREMSQELNVSRNTIREAYKILAGQGYVTIKHGNGVFVTDANQHLDLFASALFYKQDRADELFAIRKILETQAVFWAVEQLNEQKMAKLNQLLQETISAVLLPTDLTHLAVLDQQFHLTVAEFSENKVLLRIMNNLIDLLDEIRVKSMGISGRPQQSLKEHVLIIEAMLNRDPFAAQEHMFNHLESMQQTFWESKKGGES